MSSVIRITSDYEMPPPARHCHVIRSMNAVGILNVTEDRIREQGFLTSLGRYVSREEACQIARAAGQLEGRKKTSPDSALFSEDL